MGEKFCIFFVWVLFYLEIIIFISVVYMLIISVCCNKPSIIKNLFISYGITMENKSHITD